MAFRDGTNIDAEGASDDRLTIARTLYKLMVAQHPGRLVMLCDDGCVVARSDHPEALPAPEAIPAAHAGRARPLPSW